MAADFGGQHKSAYFETYSFLICDLERNTSWLNGQALFRSTALPKRRMSFKTMNDAHRRRALLPFLKLADNIEGWLVLFAITKSGGSLFRPIDRASVDVDLLIAWKPEIREKLLRILHLSFFLLSGLAAPGQDVLWIIDEDEIAANPKCLAQLTKVFEQISSNSLTHNLGRLRCGTTASDDGTFALEDLASICDLSAGALGEIGTAMSKASRFPKGKIITPLPYNLSWKSRVLATWLASERSDLQRSTCVIELESASSGIRATKLRWHAVAGQLLLPRHPFVYNRD